MYKILRVPPNKDSFAKAYEYFAANISNQKKQKLISFEDFYNHIDTIYMIQDDYKNYTGIGAIGSVNNQSSLPFLNGLCWGLTILTFDSNEGHDTDRYKKVYDLIFTIIRDKKDRPIILEGIPDNDQYIDFINALKNNRFKKHKNPDGNIIWYLIPSRFDGLLETKTRKINPNNDADVLDELAIFEDQPSYIIPDKSDVDMIPIAPPDKIFCRHEKCKGCEFFTCCNPEDKCRFEL